MTKYEELENISYNVIRREVNDFERETNDAELGNFVRGVVKLQTELYARMTEEVRSECTQSK